MSEFNHEAAIASIAAKVDNIQITLARADESRRVVYERLEAIGLYEQALSTRIDSLEKEIAKMAPVLSDYLQKMAQVKGAGMLGRMLWMLGGILLSAAVSLTGFWYWIAGRPPTP